MRDNPVVEFITESGNGSRFSRSAAWMAIWILLAVAYAVPVATRAFDRIVEVNEQARARLIERHRLWELQPDYRGSPETWTRMASRLLSDRQLMTRIALRYGLLADEIEEDYRRDLTIARGAVVLSALFVWAVPLASLFGLGALVLRRPKPRTTRTQPASASDPRYKRPPQL